MTQSKGALLFARNNGSVDYVKQAVFLAKRIRKYLDIPTSIVTDSPNYLREAFDESTFDQIIEIEYTNETNRRRYYDGALTEKVLNFKNSTRAQSYNLSPYDETLVLDTDYIICNDILKNCFDSNNNLMLFKDSQDLANLRNTREFKYISDKSVDFYWATVIFFRKTDVNKIFFDLVDHIYDNWSHYQKLYQISNPLFRNDFAFSIAVHVMNGFTKGDFVTELPIKHLYTIDKDILWEINNDEMLFLVEKEKYLGEYTPIKTKKQNVHVMNKFSLERIIDKEFNNE